MPLVSDAQLDAACDAYFAALSLAEFRRTLDGDARRAPGCARRDAFRREPFRFAFRGLLVLRSGRWCGPGNSLSHLAAISGCTA